MTYSGRVVRVHGSGGLIAGGGDRSRISCWSSGSRRRMLQTVEAIEWDRLGVVIRVDLTYPRWGVQGHEISRRHFEAWLKRWHRAFGAPSYFWKREYQRRGVVHYHLALVAPEFDAKGRRMSLKDWRVWVSRSWAEVVAGRCQVCQAQIPITVNDARCPHWIGPVHEDHWKAGTSVHWAINTNWASYFAGYCSSHSKEYQHQAPEGWEQAGRWWGHGGITLCWREQQLDEREAVTMRRLMVRYRQAVAREGKYPRRIRCPQGGMWVIGGRESASLAGQLVYAMRLWLLSVGDSRAGAAAGASSAMERSRAATKVSNAP